MYGAARANVDVRIVPQLFLCRLREDELIWLDQRGVGAYCSYLLQRVHDIVRIQVLRARAVKLLCSIFFKAHCMTNFLPKLARGASLCQCTKIYSCFTKTLVGESIEGEWM